MLGENPEQYYRHLFENSAYAVIGMDCQGKIISWNRLTETMFNAEEVSVLPEHIDRLVPDDRHQTLHRVLAGVVNERKTAEFEFDHHDKKGEQITLEVAITPVIGAEDKLLGLAAWIYDITQRKKLEQQLLHAEKMASLGTLASGVAHHFNNIIGGVATFVDYALSTNNPDAANRALQMTAQAAARIGQITQSLLTFAEKDIRHFDLSDFTEVVLTFAHLVEKPLAQKDIKLELNLKVVPVIEVPGSRVHQMLGNLLDNAEHAMPDGGTVSIELYRQGDWTILTFADTGCGIKPEDIPHIFEPFFTTRGTAGGGDHPCPGLGLSVVHGIVGELGGTIDVSSRIDEGTRFTLRFPIKSEANHSE